MYLKTYFSVMLSKKMVRLFGLFFLVWTNILTAQTTDSLVISSVETIDSLEFDTIVLEKLPGMETRWLLLDIGFNQLAYANNGQNFTPFELEIGKSMQWTLNIFRQRVNLYRGKLNLSYGFALDFSRFELKNPYIVSPFTNQGVSVISDTVGYTRNSLHVASLIVPFMLQFESNPREKSKSFHFAAGAYFGLPVGEKNKLKSPDRKMTVRGDFSIPAFSYGLQTEIGYSYLTFFGKYSLSPFFIPEADNGYDMNSWTVGIRLIPYF